MKNLFFKKNSNIAFCLIALTFLILKIFEMRFKFSDGYTYMYMAKLILNGKIPYRDFFFASPPLQPYIIAFFEIFTGNNFLILKLIPILATIGSSFFIFKFMQKKFGNWEGLTATTLYLFSFLILLTTDYSTGIHLTTFLILGMIYFIEEDKPFLAGIFGSAALLTRLYAPFPITGALVYHLIYKRKGIFKFIVGLSTIFIPISLIFGIISKGAYLNQIFFFRLHLISGIGLDKFSVVTFFLFGDLILVLGSLLWLFFEKEKKKLILPLLVTSFSIILYIIYSDIYYLYFGLIIGFLAMFTTQLLFEFNEFKNFKKFLVVLLIILVILNSIIYISNYTNSSNIPFTKNLSDFIKNNSNENGTLYGSFEITPLIALQANRKIAGNFADTNPKNIMTKEFNISEVENKIKGVSFIIVKGNLLEDRNIGGFDSSTPKNYINEKCIPAKDYKIKNDLSGNNLIRVYACKNPI